VIKLEKSLNIPKILQIKKEIWTTDLMNAVENHGGYSNIPKEELNQLLKHYRHEEIKEAVFSSSDNKCCFCESKLEEINGYPEIEHFKPKSIYPVNCFEWENLMPICRNCNGSKKNHDPICEPIINPYIDNPEEFLEFKNLKIRALNADLKGKKTIEVCNLNRLSLLEKRSKLLLELEKTLVDVERYSLEKVSDRSFLNKLNDFLFEIENLAIHNNRYSAFVKHYLKNSEEYQKLKEIQASNN